MANLSNSEATSQTMPNTSNGLMRPQSHTGSFRAQVYPNSNSKTQLSRQEYLENCLRTEDVQERLTQVPGKVLGPRCSDVKATLNRVDNIWQSPCVSHASLGYTLNTNAPRVDSNLRRPVSNQETNITYAQGIPGPSQGGAQYIHIAGYQPTVSSSSNPRWQRKRKRKNHGDGDNNNDGGGSPSHGKKPAYLKSPRPKFACPFLKASPDLTLHCHDEGGFADTSRVKEHIYRKHRNPQCPVCGMVFDRNEEYRAHLHTRSCTSPENGIPILVIDNGQENAMRSRQGLRNLSEEEKWYRIYLIIFPGADRPYPSPYVEEHVGYQPPEVPRQPRELSHEVQQVTIQEIQQQLEDVSQQPQEPPPPPQGVSERPHSVPQQLQEVQEVILREIRQQLQEVRQAIRQEVRQVVQEEIRQVVQQEVRLQLQEAWRASPPYFSQHPWQGDDPSLLGIGARLSAPENSSGENGHINCEFIDTGILQGLPNFFEQVPEEGPSDLFGGLDAGSDSPSSWP